jgi:predicted HTH domain antitoxin
MRRWTIGPTIVPHEEASMPVLIPDETLQEAGLSEREALIEVACRLFDAGVLTLWSAAKLARLNRVGFEQELLTRKIPLYRPQPSDLADDLASLDRRGG